MDASLILTLFQGDSGVKQLKKEVILSTVKLKLQSMIEGRQLNYGAKNHVHLYKF